MNTQRIESKINIFDLFTLSPETSASIEWQAGQEFYEDEEDLARELAAPEPAGVIGQWPPEIDPDEFEASYQWFIA